MKSKIKNKCHMLVLLVTIGFGVNIVNGQESPCNPVSGGTFHPMTILNATINGVALDSEDWVCIVDENGRMLSGETGEVEVAAEQWRTNLSLSAVISVTPPVPGADPTPGAVEENPLKFRIFDSSSGQFFAATPVIPEGFGPNIFTIGVLTIVQELQATGDISNNPPQAEDDTVATDEDTQITTDNFLANDSDPDEDSLTVDSIDTTGTMGTVTDNGDGTFIYDPNGQFEDLNDGDQAMDSFDYTVSDGKGGTDTAKVTVTIIGITDQVENNPPMAENDTSETDEDTPITTGDVLANDTDPDEDSLTVDSIDTTGTLGVVTDNGDGTFTYDPNGQFEDLSDGEKATDSFKYTVTDGKGGMANGTVSITINGIDDTTEDTDSDGLQDDWEISNFGDLDETGDGDPDQDGVTNLIEFQTGANPTLFSLLLQEGWNLVSVNRPLDSANTSNLLDNQTMGPFWTWNDGKFQISEIFGPNRGYWVYANNEAPIDIEN